jgi:hypothetical protein
VTVACQTPTLETPADQTPVTILPGRLAVLSALSIPAMAVVLWTTPFWLAPVYFAVVIALGWVTMGQGRDRRLRPWLQRLPGPVWLRVVALGYLAIVAEESLVGTLAAASQQGLPAFTQVIWPERMGEFILLNLFAFFGPILALALLAPRWAGVRQHHLWVVGLWGLFSERVWVFVLSSPIAALILIAPTMAVYSVILAPAVLSIPEQPGATPRPWHIPATWAVTLALALPAVAVLMQWWEVQPGLFPPCDLIGCPVATDPAP